jgi:predicted secreted protein
LDINNDTVKDIVTGEKKESVAISSNIICRDKNSTNIVAKAQRKEYKIVCDKRVIRENYTTAPYGM